MLTDDGTSAGPESESKADATSDNDKHDDLDNNPALGDAGKAAIRKERDAAKAASDRAKAAEEERDALRAEKTTREAEAAKAQEEEAAKKGEFEALAKKREQERDAAKSEATSLKGEIDQLKSIIGDALKATEKTLPDSLRDILNDTVPDETDVVGRYAWLQKPSVQKQIAEFRKPDPKAGNGRDPKSSNSSTPELKSLISKSSFLG